MPTKYSKGRSWAEEAARLREVVAARDLNPTELARRSGLDRKTITDMLEGKREPRASSFRAVCAAIGANPHYVQWAMEPRFAPVGEVVQFAPEKPPSVSNLQPVQLPGIERWLAENTDKHRITPDEREWMRTVQWPNGHIRMPDMFYTMMLNLFRQMREYSPFDDAGSGPANQQATHG